MGHSYQRALAATLRAEAALLEIRAQRMDGSDQRQIYAARAAMKRIHADQLDGSVGASRCIPHVAG